MMFAQIRLILDLIFLRKFVKIFEQLIGNKYGMVAQLVEQRPFKPFVAGSIPTQDKGLKEI